MIEVLARLWDRRSGTYGIPNLERYIATHPELFVQAIVWRYKRSDGATETRAAPIGVAKVGIKNVHSLINIGNGEGRFRYPIHLFLLSF